MDGVPAKRRPARGRGRGAIFYIAFALVLCALTAAAMRGGWLELWELRAQDLLMRARNHVRPPSPPPNIVIVAIDEASMQELRLPWPWPRTVHAALIDALAEAGAAVIAFDVLFVEPGDPLADEQLVQAVARAGNVILAADRNVTEDARFTHQIWVRPFDALADVARDLGLASIPHDPDGFIRRAFLEADGVPVLARAAAEAYLSGTGSELDRDDPERTFALPHSPREPVNINYLGPNRSVPTVSYYQALDYQSALPKDIFRDKIVLIGRSVAGVVDFDSADHFLYRRELGSVVESLPIAMAHWQFAGDVMAAMATGTRVSLVSAGALMDLGYPAAWYGADP